MRPRGGAFIVGMSPASSALVPAAILAVATGIILPTRTSGDARVLQHLLSLAVQILTAGTAAVLTWSTARGLESYDREGRTWRRISLAALLWTIGLLLYAATEWLGHRPSFPSVSEVFFVASFLTLAVALGDEFWRVHPVLTHLQRIVIGSGALGLWALMVRFLWPILASPLHPVERMLDLFYSVLPALLFSLGLGPVVAFRGRGAMYAWMAITAGVCCLALASLGIAYLDWFDLYADVHPVNLLRVAGFAFVIAGGSWRHTVDSQVATGEVVRRGNGRSWARSSRRDLPRVRTDVPLLISLGIGIVSGTLIVLLGAGVWSRRHGAPLPLRSPRPQARQTAAAQPTPAPMVTGSLPGSSPSSEPSQASLPQASPPQAPLPQASLPQTSLPLASLREAQDEFVGNLLRNPDDLKALQGLVAIRRRLAGDDPVKLRRQAAAYTEAIAKRTETPEHYTIEAMGLLARASLLGANEIDGERAKKP